MSASSSDSQANPEIGQSVIAAGIRTNLHDVGGEHAAATPVLLIHGSGPGVSAFANWRGVLPVLSQSRHVIAPDMVGFGYTEIPAGQAFTMQNWVAHIVGVMDALDIAQADVVGNSFGGALALALAIAHPTRVRRLVLMGSVGVPFDITAGLDAVWGYTPSLENMRAILQVFAHDQSMMTDSLAQMRLAASERPATRAAYEAMFPAPRQRWVDAMCSSQADIRALTHEVLVVHGREDQVIPVANAHTLADWLPNAQMHIYPNCGHWTQIEQGARFNRLITDFFNE